MEIFVKNAHVVLSGTRFLEIPRRHPPLSRVRSVVIGQCPGALANPRGKRTTTGTRRIEAFGMISNRLHARGMQFFVSAYANGWLLRHGFRDGRGSAPRTPPKRRR
jgi:hypothetical protein